MNAPNVYLSPETINRLKAHAEAFVDTPDTVVNRAVDALEIGKGSNPGAVESTIRTFNPAAPPSLSYTTVESIVFNGNRLAANETYWNTLLMAVVREAGKSLKPEDVNNLILTNSIVGKKEINGYKFLADVGVSVQGQDANGAWKAIFHILKTLQLTAEVTFIWQDNPKAAAPGKRGLLSVKWK